MIKLSDYIAKRLKEHGVEQFFMVSGGGAMHLNNSLGSVIPYIANHHEQASAMAAEGYARVNQKLAVVNVTTGPGGMNCLNGVFGQWTDSVPVLYISGQVKFETNIACCPEVKLRQLGDQEADIISTVKHLTKYSKMVTNPKEIKYHLDRAIYEATTGRKGPVWLDIPMNVQSAMINEEELLEFQPPKPQQSKINFQELIERILKAKRPIIISGHGIRLANQIEEFHKLVEKLRIPVVTTLNGYDLMENDNPYYIGRIGTIGQRAGNFALQNADLILCLGTRNNVRQTSYNWENFGKNAFKVAVDIDSAELNKPTLKIDLKICADLKDFFSEFPIDTIKINTEDWLKFCQGLKNKYSFENHPEQLQKEEIINPYYFTYCLSKCMNEGDVLVTTNGSASVCIFQNAVIKKNQRYIGNSGNASMGFGLPASIGACLQAGGKNVICLEGDGSIMMNLQELQTIKHNQLPIKIFVINNNGYSSIRQTQKNFFNGNMTGSGEDSGVSVPDFTKLAMAFGIKTYRLDNPKTMEKDIKEILLCNEPVLVEVMVEKEYDFAPKLSSRRLADGSMVSASLEDMFPFLDRKEYEENMI